MNSSVYLFFFVHLGQTGARSYDWKATRLWNAKLASNCFQAMRVYTRSYTHWHKQRRQKREIHSYASPAVRSVLRGEGVENKKTRVNSKVNESYNHPGHTIFRRRSLNIFLHCVYARLECWIRLRDIRAFNYLNNKITSTVYSRLSVFEYFSNVSRKYKHNYIHIFIIGQWPFPIQRNGPTIVNRINGRTAQPRIVHFRHKRSIQ